MSNPRSLLVGALLLAAPTAGAQTLLGPPVSNPPLSNPPAISFPNPYMMGDTRAAQVIPWTAGQVTLPEFALQVYGTSGIGGGHPTTAFKGSIAGLITCNAGSADCYGGNFVTHLSAGLAPEIGGIALEADLNVQNADYGNAPGAPQPPYAAGLYISGTGPHRATCAICVNYAAGGISFNRGLVFWNGTTAANTIEDYTSAPNGAVLFAQGAKRNGIDFSGATLSGAGILMPHGVSALAQADSTGTMRPLIRLNTDDQVELGDARRPVRAGGAILAGSGGDCGLAPTAASLTWRCSAGTRQATDIRDARPALPAIDGLRIRDYQLENDRTRQVGVLAQEVVRTHPDMVHTAPDGTLSVDTLNPWVLVKAIQELEARVRQLEAQRR